MSQQDIEAIILEFLAKVPDQEFKARELAHRLGLRGREHYSSFKNSLRRLVARGQVALHRRGYYTLNRSSESVRGILEMNRAGYGMVYDETISSSVMIPQKLLGSAFDGDEVEVLILPRESSGQQRRGRVTKIIRRAHQSVVGTIERYRRYHWIIPDDPRFPSRILLSGKLPDNAAEGDKVVVAIDEWGDDHHEPSGHILDVLGAAGELSVEIRSVLREFQLPLQFPPSVDREAGQFPATLANDDLIDRLDLRALLCFTIDPEDARDFDDAISLVRNGNGTLTLGVHIADVSHFVQEGSLLDREAFARGTSVYFPSMVIPMLPEQLSAELCSLQERKDRLTFSVLMNLSEDGTIESYDIRPSVINSRKRFSYEEVEEILEHGKNHALPREVYDTLQDMKRLAATLTARRLSNGSIDFETAEVRFKFDADGNPVELVKKIRLVSHRIVEEFMLLANKVVARHIGMVRREDHPKPFLYRVHDAPDPEKLRELSLFVRQFGYRLDSEGTVSSKALQKLLNQVRGSEVENVINEVTLRAMAKAVYSERNIGHYGLAFEHYAHFTSPIRRYPDLVVHRLLKEYQNELPAGRRQSLAERLPSIAKHSSERERTAMEAEREAIKVYQVEYMKRHVGDELEGVISGVTRYGLFVEISDLLAEGLVHVRSMDDDYYSYDEKKLALVGRDSGRLYRLGDTVNVKVGRVSSEEREIDFFLISERRAGTGRKKRRSRRSGT